jgi:hypothetical protein
VPLTCQASQHTHGGRKTASIFIPDAGLPLALREGGQGSQSLEWIKVEA